MIRPPAVPPNWLRFRVSRTGCSRLRLGRALRSPLRRNSKRSPWKALAPDLVTMLTTPPGCKSVLGRQSVGLHVEFLDRIRERNGQVHVAEGVVVIAAVQQEVDAVGRAAGNRILAGTVGSLHVLAARQVAAVQGHVRKWRSRRSSARSAGLRPLSGRSTIRCCRDDLGYRRVPGLHHAGAGLHLNRLGQRAHLQRDVLGEVFRHLQNDAGLHIILKAVRLHLEAIRTRPAGC